MKMGCRFLVFGFLALGLISAIITYSVTEETDGEVESSTLFSESAGSGTSSTKAANETSKGEGSDISLDQVPSEVTRDLTGHFDAAASLYLRLKEMRYSQTFHELGFGLGSPHRQWYVDWEMLKEKAGLDPALLEHEVVVGDLYTLGKEWMKNHGKDSEVSQGFALKWDGVLDEAKKSGAVGRDLTVARVWTSADGAKSFVGKYVSQTGDQVTVLREGELVTFSISYLSKMDRQLLERGD